jgi:hypothetical protein
VVAHVLDHDGAESKSPRSRHVIAVR